MNEQAHLAERYVNETGVSLFLTGKAGTGKTTFLHHIVESCPKRNVVLAPTGVAAVNAGGVTIHSFFQLPLCPYLPDVPELVTEYQMPESHKQLNRTKMDIIRTLDLLIIDEISMVRADLLDAVDATLRRYRRSSRPFGGVQLLLIGDVQQLAPVVSDEERPYLERVYPSPFFFHSKALQRLQYVTIQLTTVYRQQDPVFLTLLNNIRDNRFDAPTLDALNARVKAQAETVGGQEPIMLTTHNYQADEVNRRHMQALPSASHFFDAMVEGNFPDSSAPTERHLELKEGAQVMFVKNDSSGHRYYNGMIGRVEKIIADEDDESGDRERIEVVNEEGEHINVTPERWENIKYEIDKSDNKIKQVVEGSFLQYPLKTAWAITIHKAQGLTFDRVQVDAAAAFAYGQVYVALSRCRSLEGLTLLSPISPHNAFESRDIVRFNNSMTPPGQAEEMLDVFRSQYFYDVLFELFDFGGVRHDVEQLRRLYQEHLVRLFPDQAAKLSDLCSNEVEGLMTVAERFHRQLVGISQQPLSQTRELLSERVGKAVEYFAKELQHIDEAVSPLLDVEIDNKETSVRLKEIASRYRTSVGMKKRLLETVGKNGFTVEGYQKAKVDYALEKPEKESRRRVSAAPEGVKNPKLVRPLSVWRKSKAEELDLPPYAILTQKTLFAIVNALPTTLDKLSNVVGIGKVKLDKFGKEIVQMVRDYCSDNGIEQPDTEEAAPPATREEKEPMWRRTAEMMAEGKTLEQIAAELHRAAGTVESYVLQAVEEGAVDADRVVPPQAQDEIVSFFLEHHDVSRLKEVYEHFEGRYSYLQLRVARHIAAGM